MNAYDIVAQNLSSAFALSEFKTVSTACNCDCCGRHSQGYGGLSYYIKKQNADQLDELLCPTCVLFNLQNKSFGLQTNSAFYKLSSFKGGYLIVYSDCRPSEIYLGGGFFTRFTSNNQVVSKKLSGNAAKLALLSDQKDRTSKVVIELTPRRELYLKNLRLSDENHLCLASENGLTMVDYRVFDQLKTVIMAFNQNQQAELIKHLHYLATGLIRSDNDRLQKSLSLLDDMQKAVISKALGNPIGFVFMLDALKALDNR